MTDCSNAALQGGRQSRLCWGVLEALGALIALYSSSALLGLVSLIFLFTIDILSWVQGYTQLLKPGTFGSVNRWKMKPLYLKLFKCCSGWGSMESSESSWLMAVLTFRSHLPLNPLWLRLRWTVQSDAVPWTWTSLSTSAEAVLETICIKDWISPQTISMVLLNVHSI